MTFLKILMLCIGIIITTYIMGYIFSVERPSHDKDFYKDFEKWEEEQKEKLKNNDT